MCINCIPKCTMVFSKKKKSRESRFFQVGSPEHPLKHSTLFRLIRKILLTMIASCNFQFLSWKTEQKSAVRKRKKKKRATLSTSVKKKPVYEFVYWNERYVLIKKKKKKRYSPVWKSLVGTRLAKRFDSVRLVG